MQNDSSSDRRDVQRMELLSYLPEIMRFVRASVRTAADAEDLTQDVFAQALTHRDTVRDGNLRGWLYQIARNRISTHYRRKATETHAMERIQLQTRGTTADNPAEPEFLEAARRAIEALPEKEREALQLKFSRQYTNEEIAELMGMSTGNLGVLVHRALKKVRARLEAQGHER